MRRKISYSFGVLFLLFLLVTLSQVHRDIPVDRLKEAYAPAPSKFMNIAGMQVHYRDEGKGFPVILIHGMASSLHTWQGWSEILDNQYRVIRLDLPAFGLTGASAGNNYSPDTYVQVVHTLLDSLGVKECFMVGNSLGGLITWHYALAHPEQVKKIVLIDAAGYPMKIFDLARLPGASFTMRYITPRSIVEKSLHEVYGDPAKVTDEMIDRYFNLTLREGNRSAFVAFVGQVKAPDPSAIKQVKTPTLILWGEKDRWIPLEHASNFHRDIAGSQLITYPSLGHVPQEEDAALTCKDAMTFLATETDTLKLKPE